MLIKKMHKCIMYDVLKFIKMCSSYDIERRFSIFNVVQLCTIVYNCIQIYLNILNCYFFKFEIRMT